MDSRENPKEVGRGMTANEVSERKVTRVERGEVIGNVQELFFRDRNHFRARELHSQLSFWEIVGERRPSTTQTEVLGWIRDKVSIFSIFSAFYRVL